ncbi:MAG: M15 family metallopeptidase [Steroidobacteraceae bacterium]
MNDAELTGQARTHIAAVAHPACLLHADVVAPFLNLRHAALEEGIDLQAMSSFRDFDRQLAIWNGKFSGERPMLDAAGAKLDAASLSPRERIDAILLWSALPGGSRHHWGTDLDLVDRGLSAAGYQIKLTREEFGPGGQFAQLDLWLTANAPRFGFFRPFQGVRSGVQPEPWHFSFAPIAEKARQRLSPQILRTAIAGAPLLGKEVVLGSLEELHARYVAAIDLP